MDRDRTELAARALRLLPTSSTALNRRVVPVRTVPFVNTHVVQWLACGAEIAVFFRHVSELVDQIVIEVTQFGSAISLGQVRRIRVGGRHLVLLMDWLAIAVLLL